MNGWMEGLDGWMDWMEISGKHKDENGKWMDG